MTRLLATLSRIPAGLAALAVRIRAYLAPVADSVEGTLNRDEVYRVITTACATGGLASIPDLLIRLLSDPAIFTPTAPVFEIAFAAAVADLLRRLQHRQGDPK